MCVKDIFLLGRIRDWLLKIFVVLSVGYFIYSSNDIMSFLGLLVIILHLAYNHQQGESLKEFYKIILRTLD